MSGRDNERWVRPLGAAAAEGWDVAVVEGDGWSHTSLRVTELAAGERREVQAPGLEHVVVPLRGDVTVSTTPEDGEGHTAELAGRASVFPTRRCVPESWNTPGALSIRF